MRQLNGVDFTVV